MAFAHSVWHVNAYGRIYQGAEQWNCGFWMGHETADAPAPTVEDASAIAARFKTFFGAPTSHISWAFVFDGIKIQHWNADGTMNKANTVFSAGVTPQAGGESRNVVPQLALAVSFRGAIGRGPGANSRMFVPGFNNIPTISGHIEQADLDGIKANAKTMFDGINSDVAARGVGLIIASKGGKAPVTPPVNVTVDQLRIGDVVDTIQRRRNALRESYSTTTITVGSSTGNQA